MNWIGLLSFKAARDPELAPHAYLMYLLLWTVVVGLFVLFLFPLQVWYFHNNNLFAD